MRLNRTSPLVRLYRRAYVEDRAWLAVLWLTPQVECVPEEVVTQIRRNQPQDAEAREALFWDWINQENNRLDAEASEACRVQMETGRLSLCPFFWKTITALFVYGLVWVPVRGCFRWLDHWLFSPAVSFGSRATNWFQVVFTRRVVTVLTSLAAAVLLLVSLSGGFWGQAWHFGSEVLSGFGQLSHEVSEEISRNRAGKVRLTQEKVKVEAEAKSRAEAEAQKHQMWALAYPERAAAEAEAQQLAVQQAEKVRADREAQEARWRQQAKAYEWQQTKQDLKEVGQLILIGVAVVVSIILSLLGLLWFFYLLDKTVDLVLSLFVLVAFINYPKLGDGLGTLVDGTLDFWVMVWSFLKAVKARACPLIQFQ